MRVDLTETGCTVTREPGDPRVRKSGWGAAPESHLLYLVQRELRRQGVDIVKRRLQADGHLMGDEGTQYLRARDWSWGLVDDHYAIRDLAAEYRSTGTVWLQRVVLKGGE